MLRNVCVIVAFVALVALTNGVVDAQGGKKGFGGKKAPPVNPDVKEDADGRTKQGPTYMPLQVGNRWEYTLTQKDKSATLVTKIARIEVIGTLALAVLESEIDGKVTSTEHLREENQGVFRVKSGQLAPSPPFLVLKSPVKGGDKWSNGFAIGKNKGSYAVETAEEEIEVPAGKFKTVLTAFTVKLGAKPSVTKTWYAENVGVVKQTIGEDVVAVLQKFEVPTAPIARVDGNRDGNLASFAVHYPVDVGNRWEYDLNTNGIMTKMVMRIERMETIDKVPLSVLEAEIDGKVVATEHLRQANDGVYRHRMGPTVLTPPFLVIKTPLKGGDKWSGSFSAGNNRVTFVSQSNEEDIEVPAGQFTAVRVRTVADDQGKKLTTTSWYAENVGFVKQTIDGGGLNIVAELRSHEKKAAPLVAQPKAPAAPLKGPAAPPKATGGLREK